MEILYRSTRSNDAPISASKAILQGLAPDGGLYVPESIPKLPASLNELSTLSYQELALKIMSCYFTDFTQDELKKCIESAYDEKFDTRAIAPLVRNEKDYYLELFHGATIAFKDMALSILPHLMTTSARKNNITDDIVILTATSGDTGKAALSGFSDVEGTRIVVFYPKDGVSAIQEKQMVTQKGNNCKVVAVRGNFDDCQSCVKEMFADESLKKDASEAGFRFSSANSINIGRLVPQIVYYIYAYCILLSTGKIKEGQTVNIVVPTGNFGNILAAHYAKLMGLPVNKLICASNENKVLYDFFETGTYDRNREFHLTSSPSMDILISSNLERLIYEIAGRDFEATASFMSSLSKEGVYTISPSMKEKLSDFRGGYADEERTSDRIRTLYEDTGYVMDPHTAVASAVCEDYKKASGDGTVTIIASTASPYKFTRSVMKAIDQGYSSSDELELAQGLSKISGVPVPKAIDEIRTAPVLHREVVDKNGLTGSVRAFLGI